LRDECTKEFDMYEVSFKETLLKQIVRGAGFFSLRDFGQLFLTHLWHWHISVICLIFVIKLALTVFIGLNFQTFWPKSQKFFRLFQNDFDFWPLNTGGDESANIRFDFVFLAETISPNSVSLWAEPD